MSRKITKPEMSLFIIKWAEKFNYKVKTDINNSISMIDKRGIAQHEFHNIFTAFEYCNINFEEV